MLLTKQNYEDLVTYCFSRYVTVHSHYELSDTEFCLALSTYKNINSSFDDRAAKMIIQKVLNITANSNQDFFGDKIIIYFPTVQFDFCPNPSY